MNIDILGVSEVRWTGSGVINSENTKMIHSGGQARERGIGVILNNTVANSVKGYWAISDRILSAKLNGKPFDINMIQVYEHTSEKTEDEIEQFYEELETAKVQCKSQKVTIVMGDFNAKIGAGNRNEVNGGFGLGERNERGEGLAEWAQTNDMIIGNSWFNSPCQKIMDLEEPRRQSLQPN